ncbi:SusC/RagA family TonB-linked outer membrane protein [Aliifodinibius halophilus]|uniref:SusC/RagA family TonB-linked outer membrane protein n=2 Tax=Fodinibius halophilus TaxID=1736908 RepID=A0A6M1TBQ7_9BACT|nr:SusC/RagA family TonB-linked outer membrane protein [Fodinibius halophilus]
MAAICFMFVLLVGAVPAIAQSSTVSGTVLSADDESPLPGVNIVEVGTQRGTTSDTQGEFSLEVSSADASLRLTFVGFASKTIDLNGRSEVTVTLEPKTEALDDVVVTALGLERQSKSLGYSVSEVSSDELVTGTETNTANLLQGTVAGVNVSPTSGGPGSSSRITIRGASSLDGNNQPLYVVDGIPIDNSNFGSAGKWGGFDGGDGISSINSEDIENISVLKGASAAALYGARARDGVIVITTKSGNGIDRGPVLNVSSTFTWNDALVGFADYQDKYGQGSQGQKPQNQTEALATGLSSWGAPLDGSSVVQFDGQKRAYKNHGDQLENFYRAGVSSKNSLSLSGGDQNSTYYFSTTYFNSESIVPNSGLERLSLTLRGSQKIGKFKADVKANYVDESTNNRPWLSDSPGNANFAVGILPPNVSLDALQNNYMDEDGMEQTPSNSPWINNPYWVVNQYDTDDNKGRIIGHVDLSYEIADWLSLNGRTGLDRYTLRRSSFTPWGTTYRPGGDMTEEEFRVLESTTDLILKLDRQLTSAISLNATVGGAVSYRKNETVGSSGSDFKVPNLKTISNMSNVSPIYAFSEKQVNSVYGSLSTSYNDYLFLTVTGRNDWYSTLPANDNALLYPSISTSFVFTEAFSGVMPDWMSFGKLRASWAEVGSDTDPYSLFLNYKLLNLTHQGQSAASVGNISVPLSTLKPTSTKELEFGVDLRFFDDRLGIDATWYDRQTTDQILSTTVSKTTGYDERFINAGQLDNSGFELLLTVVPVNTDNLLWETKLNYAQNNSEVVALAGEQESLKLAESRTTTATIQATIGEEYGTIRGFKYKRDEDGNIIHKDGLPVPSDEQTVLGKGTPDWTLGWSNSVSYKSWSLNALVGVHWGGELFSGTNSYAYGAGLHKNTLEGRAECDADGVPYSDCFVAEGVTANGSKNQTAVEPGVYYSHIEDEIAEEFVYDANFVKLRQLQLSYQLPQSLIAKIPVRSATVSLTGRNLLYFYNSVPNVDPEAAINRGNAQGLELAGVPSARSFGLNIDIGF